MFPEATTEAPCIGASVKDEPRVLRPNRPQLELRPVDLEGVLPAGHRVRIVWEFVEGLDLGQPYAQIRAAEGHGTCPQKLYRFEVEEFALGSCANYAQGAVFVLKIGDQFTKLRLRFHWLDEQNVSGANGCVIWFVPLLAALDQAHRHLFRSRIYLVLDVDCPGGGSEGDGLHANDRLERSRARRGRR